MKHLLLIILISLSLQSFARHTYYVSNAGDDTHAGTSSGTAWRTVIKLNATTLIPGDSVLFRKGDSWTFSTINVNQSGTSLSPIVFSWYGTGALPLMDGYLRLTGWTSYGGGIYSITDSRLGTGVNLLTLDNVITPVARFPKTTYRTFTAYSGNNSITDAGLTGTYLGGEVVIRKNHYFLNKGNNITSQSGGRINFIPQTGAMTPTSSGWGYFIQNHINCLMAFGDWCYNASTHTLYFYFGTNTPSAYTINASATTNLFVANSKNYITIDGLAFRGANQYAITGANNNTFKIINCTISDAGVDGVKLDNQTGSIITHNTISNCNNSAIWCYTSVGAIWEYNNLSHNGMIPGAGLSGDLTGGAGAYSAMYLGDANTSHTNIIWYNIIMNTGYNGAYINGDTFNFSYNYILGATQVLDDGGGFYTHGQNNLHTYVGRTVSYNIILNSYGMPLGTADGKNEGVGLYSDDFGANINIHHNTITGAGQYGMYLHNNQNDTVTYNLIYNNGFSQMAHVHDGIALLALPIGFVINHNALISVTSSQFNWIFYSIASNSTGADFTGWGTSNNNYFANISSNTVVFQTQLFSTSVKPRNFSTVNGSNSSWQTFTGKDASSTFSHVTAPARFDYNPTGSGVTLSLPLNYLDLAGNTIPAGSYTLGAYSGSFLIENGITPPPIGTTYKTRRIHYPIHKSYKP